MKTAKKQKKRFGPGLSQATIPAGLRVAPTGRKGEFWLDEFPPDIFPRGSIALHDAIHYGVTYHADEVTP
jgi:hypothetical protein